MDGRLNRRKKSPFSNSRPACCKRALSRSPLARLFLAHILADAKIIKDRLLPAVRRRPNSPFKMLNNFILGILIKI